MTMYRCRVLTADGTRRTQYIPGEDRESVSRRVTKEGSFLISAAVVRNSSGASTSRKSVYDLTQTLALLSGSGLSIRDSLTVARTVFTKGPTAALTEDLARRVQQGSSVSEAVAAYGKGFPPIYAPMIRIAERVGSLHLVLENLLNYLELQRRLRGKFINAMIYPLFVLVLAASGVFCVTAFLLPRIVGLFEEVGQGSPEEMEQALAGLRGSGYGVLGVVIFILILTLTLLFVRSRGGKAAEKADRLLLAIPGIGTMISQRLHLVFSFAMETLVSSGISIEESLSESAGVLSNKAMSSALLRARIMVVNGTPLSGALSVSGLFHPRIITWVRIGEGTGKVDQVFGQLRRYYQETVDTMVARITALTEPVLIAFVGGVIIYLVLTFIVPLFSVFTSIL